MAGCGCLHSHNRLCLVSGEAKPLALDSPKPKPRSRRAEPPPLSMWRRRRSTTLTAIGGGFGQINTPAAAVADAILRLTWHWRFFSNELVVASVCRTATGASNHRAGFHQ